MTGKYRIILADDNAIIRRELRSILEESQQFIVAGEARDGVDLLNLLDGDIRVDALIIDLFMPRMTGVEALRNIQHMKFEYKSLILTMCKEPEFLCQSFSAGANGYMLKDGIGKELLGALPLILDNKVYLSPLITPEIPDSCRFKSYAGQKLSSAMAHCSKNA